MKTAVKYIIILLMVVITLGGFFRWLVNDYLGITSIVALNAIRVTWILGIIVGFLLGRNWKAWRNLWGF